MSATLICSNCEKEFQLSDEKCPNCGARNPVYGARDPETVTPPVKEASEFDLRAVIRSKIALIITASAAIITVTIVIIFLASGREHLKGSLGMLVSSDGSSSIFVDKYAETALALAFPDAFDKHFTEESLLDGPLRLYVHVGAKAKAVDLAQVKYPDSSRSDERIEVLIVDGPYKGREGWVDADEFQVLEHSANNNK